MGDIIGGELRFLTIDRSCPAMRGMLRFDGLGMSQSEKGFGTIVGHGDVNVTSVVIQVNFETEVTGPRQVFVSA